MIEGSLIPAMFLLSFFGETRIPLDVQLKELGRPPFCLVAREEKERWGRLRANAVATRAAPARRNERIAIVGA
jgi:hypothetical protein